MFKQGVVGNLLQYAAGFFVPRVKTWPTAETVHEKSLVLRIVGEDRVAEAQAPVVWKVDNTIHLLNF